MALGTGVHVVPDTDGLFEQAFHTPEVHTAVHQALHSTETEGSEGQFASWQQWQPRVPQGGAEEAGSTFQHYVISN